jgi:phosphatidylglycerol---prolipoprotein diacylglyceryl transferase
MLQLFQNLFSPPRHLIIPVMALWLGLWLAERHSRRRGLPPEALSNLVFTALLSGLVGGRLLYALAHIDAFRNSPLSLFSPNIDLFDPVAGLAVGLLAALIYGQRQRLAFWPTLDALVPALAVAGVGLGLMNLASGQAFGKATDLPWGIVAWGTTRHPSQVYETLASLLVLILVWSRQDQKGGEPGSRFMLFTTLSAGARVFLEAFRGDSTLIPGGIRAEQMAAWLVLVASLLILERLKKLANHTETLQ